MDWPTFIKDNSQALFTLIGVFLGAAITFLINYLNNKFQAKENDKERIEKRIEAKVQLAIELMKNDLKRIEDASNVLFESIERIHILSFKRDLGEITQEEWGTELKSLVTSANGIGEELIKNDAMTDIVVYMHGDEIISTHNDCNDAFHEYLKRLGDPSVSDEDKNKAYGRIVTSYGKLQTLLRDKLISIRDTD